ncbi:MAG: ferredoxin [Kiritimatiellae bacterium]|nr:ferredoxin [Kiritimatiellia bacterium]
MKAMVDSDTCTGCGLCADICPEVFEMYDGLARAKVESVPEGAEATCREASDGCPPGAISIKE